jgi:predicted phage-related endonuclease
MRARCENPKHMHFGRYGGRGISVCDRWRRSFADFVADMGPRPDGHTLDRVNNDGNYEPDNCRWATRKQQSNNRDSARGERSGNSKLTESTVLAIRAAVSAGGFTQQQIASRFGISRASIYYVVRRLSWKHVPLASSSATRAGGLTMALTKKRLEMGAGAYGASEVGTLAGLNKFSTPIDIYEAHVSGFRNEAGLPAELGLLLEEPIAKLASKELGLHLVRCDTLRHPQKVLAIATPDRLSFVDPRKTRAIIHSVEECAGAVSNVQIKTASMWNRREWGEPGTDAIPEAYLAQVQWEMGITGLRVTDIPVLFDKAEFSIFRVPFNEQLFLGLYEIVERFHSDHVLARQPPPPDASERYKEFLGRAFPTTNDVVLHLDEGDARAALAAQYGRLKMVEKAIDGELKLLGNQLRTVIGINKGLASPVVGSVSRVWCKPSTGTDWESLARAAIDPVELNEWVVKYQREKRPGYWKLQPRWSKEFQAQLEPELLSVRQRLELSDGGGTEDELRVMEPMQEQ